MLLADVCEPNTSPLHWDFQSWSWQPIWCNIYPLNTPMKYPYPHFRGGEPRHRKTQDWVCNETYLYHLSTPSFYGSHQVLVLFPSKWGRAFKKDFLVDSQHNLMAFTHLTCSSNTKTLNKYSWANFLDANSWLFTPDVYNLYTINVFNMKIPALSFSLISLVLPVLFNLPVVCSPTSIKSISNTAGAVGIWALPICSL